MIESLISLSTWVEDNSGQIQIVIAVCAIWLALAGYKRVLQQIEISTKQENQANEQRNYELKIQAFSLLVMASDRNQSTLKNIYSIRDYLEDFVENHKDKMNYDGVQIEEVLNSTAKKIEIIKEAQKLIQVSYTEINKRDSIDQKTIQLLYEALLAAINDSNNYELIKQNFLEK